MTENNTNNQNINNNQNTGRQSMGDKFKNKMQKKKESHFKSVQKGSILYYFYKFLAFLYDLIEEIQNMLSTAVDKQQKANNNDGGEDY